MQAAKAQARLRICAVSLEPSLLPYVINTEISCTAPFILEHIPVTPFCYYKIKYIGWYTWHEDACQYSIYLFYGYTMCNSFAGHSVLGLHRFLLLNIFVVLLIYKVVLLIHKRH